MMTNRLPWIDHLKGIAILLVIIGHLIIDSGIEKEGNDPVKWFIYTFHMPLFFFLSGIVLGKLPTLPKLASKLLAFIAPFFVIGVGYTYFIGFHFDDFMYDRDKYGYWYLFVLSWFYVFHYFMGIPQKLGCKNKLFEIAVAGIVFFILWCFMKAPQNLCGLLSIEQMYFNWPFFVTGYFLHNNVGVLNKRVIVLPLSLGLYITSAYIFEQTQFLGTVTYYLRGMGMIMFLFSLFYKNTYINESFTGNTLAYIGTKTLDIYIFHYFVKLVISIRLFGTWVYEDRYYIGVITLTVTLAVLISYTSIYIGKAVRLIPILRNVVYGKSFKQ